MPVSEHYASLAAFQLNCFTSYCCYWSCSFWKI